MKVQKLRDTRDYSFLMSDDAEFPASSKEYTPRNVPVPTSGALDIFINFFWLAVSLPHCLALLFFQRVVPTRD